MALKLLVEDSVAESVVVHVEPWDCVKDIKDAIQEQIGIPAMQQRLFHAGHELQNAHTVHDSGLRNEEKLFLSTFKDSKRASGSFHSHGFIGLYGNCPCPKALHTIILQVWQLLQSDAFCNCSKSHFLRTFFPFRHVQVTLKTCMYFVFVLLAFQR